MQQAPLGSSPTHSVHPTSDHPHQQLPPVRTSLKKKYQSSHDSIHRTHRGTWRTMLSDEPVFEAKMLRGSKPFHFTMEQEQVQIKREKSQAAGGKPAATKKKQGGTIFSKYFPKWLYWLHWNKVPSKSNHSMRVCYISLLSVWSHRKSKCQWHRDNLVLTSQLVCDHNRWMRQTKYILQIKQQ